MGILTPHSVLVEQREVMLLNGLSFIVSRGFTYMTQYHQSMIKYSGYSEVAECIHLWYLKGVIENRLLVDCVKIDFLISSVDVMILCNSETV